MITKNTRQTMTEEQNTKNMMSCPRYKGCSIPKCPLDFWASERIEKKDDSICANWRYLGRIRQPRMVEKRNQKLKKLITDIEKKRQNRNTGQKGVIKGQRRY